MSSISETLAEALAYHRAGQLAEALRLYERVLAADAEHVEAHFLRGAAYHGLGQEDEAMTSLARAIRLEPDHAEAHHHLGAVLAQQGKLDEAIASFQRALQLRPDATDISANLRVTTAARDESQGNALAAQGKLTAAVACYRRALEQNPDSAEAHNSLGAVLEQQGSLAAAAACCRRAAELNPGLAEAQYNLGAILRRQGDSAGAVDCYRRALLLKPEFAEAHNNLGSLWEERGRLDDAAACCRRALELRADFAEAHNNLGAVLARQEHYDEAAAECRRALELKPGFAEAHNNLGTALAKQEKRNDAAACYRQAIALKPGFAEAHNNLAAVLRDQDHWEEAAASCRRALELNPDLAEAHGNLGAILTRQEKFDDAAAQYRRALELKPDFAEVHNHLGVLLSAQREFDKAAVCWRQALALQPSFADVHHNRGVAFMQQGRADEASACFQKALEAKPQLAAARNAALVALQYQPSTTLTQLAAAHREYDERHAAPLRSTWRPHDNRPDPDRRLRLGFVSADLYFHPVGYFLVRVLENLDRRQAETVCYSDRLKTDAMTGRLRAAATNWRDARTMNDQQLADQIRADRIDIAFDLAGHTGGNRLLTFARKPAPIQISWIGYVGTTGLSAMDYLLADRYQVPQTAEAHIQERVLRMPDGYVCYDPPRDASPVASLPALARGYVTFGSFNNPAKITPEVVELWSKILRRVSGSRLVLKYLGVDIPSVTRRFTEMFAQRGVDSTRLELLGGSGHEELLQQYQRIDVALDPFPYSGGLTTCEALWMGVPVVTCPGETFASRHSLSHLSNVGLTETIAADRDEYVEIAVRLAADLPRLAGIRARLRQQMADSPLCDGRRFAANLMDVLRGAWRPWCANQLAN